ncbi:ergosterol biosynthesis ERG4/ERG24 [Protomyces lactucae-debilis]|uniref:7-dehydrocholesterol reductase n=1 Tax=Protomyces lactucae-debilis TaxID=2754530 RepID=A0A1Y2FLC0_PROLT|nr:ergosterol biosynthesis ERG4/ERG24 [Protomyces lactucae-debilis]ORY84763.1 ergosterol biosynthesis ERG4/ERG24 [Protomyces lactucae-debilis]
MVVNRRSQTSPEKANVEVSPAEIAKAASKPSSPTSSWGRQGATSWGTTFGAVFMLMLCPLMTNWFLASCTHYQCNMFTMPLEVAKAGSWQHIKQLLSTWLPMPTWKAAQIYAGWLVFQAVLYVTVPGSIGYGQRTPAGHLLPYYVNGLSCYLLSHVLFVGGAYLGYWKLSIIADNWSALFVLANLAGYGLTTFCYIKAYVAPSHAEDRKFTGSAIYDYFMGIEFNPRIGEMFDFKLFFNGRPGIIAWTMIDISFAAAQYQSIGYVTNSMWIVIFLHALYVIDFFWNEDWYLRTIDIAHDHMGFYLAWGDLVWLPLMYTLQAQYLYYNPLDLANWAVVAILAIGLVGYYIFRATNHQKDIVRSSDGKCNIWGKPAEVIRTTYKTSDGVSHKSLLLVSGWWGLAHQINYFGDLLISLAMCLCCGTGHNALLGYFYVVYMFILLNHRILRSEDRCKAKYGKYWDEYCARVKYKMIPGIY